MVYDIVIVGCGINGAAVARDASLRGLRVLILEKSDIGAATSASSTKLIHGGLRYLEFYEFRLVRKALQEREKLLHIAPHVVRPMRFVLPHIPSLRPRWMMAAGLFLYDHLTRKNSLERSSTIHLQKAPEGEALKAGYKTAFEYSDCWADDHRLVLLTALDAVQHGARLERDATVTQLTAAAQGWQIAWQKAGKTHHATARVVVNATGPWAAHFLEQTLPEAKLQPLRTVKGSHIVVPQLFEHEKAYFFQNKDGRMVFAIPYERDFTMIGTTEETQESAPETATLSEAEKSYLLDIANHYFKKKSTPEDIVWHFSGVRPLMDNEHSNTQASRDYKVEKQEVAGAALVNIWGGKLTTHRVLAEDVLRLLQDEFPALPPCRTASTLLPGGALPQAMKGLSRASLFAATLKNKHPWMPYHVLERYTHSYGTRSALIMKGVKTEADMGTHFGAGLYAREVDYLCRHEWAQSAEDILWRRTKCGLRMTPKEVQALKQYLARQSEPKPKEARV